MGKKPLDPEPEESELPAGYLPDFVSGITVKATPEESQSTQVFSRRLVEDFGYPKTHIITRPQYERTNKVLEKQPPQLLFIERCIEFLKPGGRMGIIVPESILGMPTYTDIVQFIRGRVRIVGVVSMPDELFQPHTHAKTAVLFIKNVPPSDDDKIFMSVVEWCGHDSRGNPTLRIKTDGTEELLDDVPNVVESFRKMVKDFK